MPGKTFLLSILLFATCFLWAAEADRAVMVRDATLRVSPSDSGEKLGEISRGREIVVVERSHDWVKVFANVEKGRNVTGWVLDKGLVHASTPQGDAILFGEAVDSEDQAAQRGGRKGAAQDAMRLYAKMAEFFPNSSYAGEALYRAADVHWQMERADASTRASYRAADPDLRPKIDEEEMRTVMRKYSHTKWADLAAYTLLENKICGDWEARSKCPERESEIYEKYASDHPQSPKAAEALYNAAYRQSALIEIYKAEDNSGKSAGARNKALSLAQRVSTQFPEVDWARRAQALAFKIQQNIPTFGNASE